MNEKIIDIIKEMSGNQEIKLCDHLSEDVGLDSMNMVLLLLEVENMLGVELKEEDMNPNALIYVSDIMQLAEKYIKVGEGNES